MQVSGQYIASSSAVSQNEDNVFQYQWLVSSVCIPRLKALTLNYASAENINCPLKNRLWPDDVKNSLFCSIVVQ